MPVKSRVPFGLQKKILKDLKHNQEAPTPRKKSHTQIANAHSTNKLIITVDRVRKMNAHYKASRLRRGQAVTRTIPPAPGRAEVPARIKLLILEDLNITQEQVRRKLKLSTNQFATVMSQFGLTFRGMKVKERKKAIATLSFVIKPGTSRNFTNREIAEELGLGARYVEEHRPRRGKSSGSKAQIEAVMKETIIWTELITKPDIGQINYSQLLELTGSNPFTLSAAIKKLKKERALVEVNTTKEGLTFIPTKGERYFFIGANGVAIRRALGAKPRTKRSVDAFSLDQLEKMYDQLSFLKLHGTFKVSPRMLSLIRTARDQQRYVEFKRKNKM